MCPAHTVPNTKPGTTESTVQCVVHSKRNPRLTLSVLDMFYTSSCFQLNHLLCNVFFFFDHAFLSSCSSFTRWLPLVGLVQVIQYIDFIKPDSSTGSQTQNYDWIPADGFGDDEEAGHGTHTAGTAAGATLNNPAETIECDAGQTLSCVGACIDAMGTDDDLVTYYYQAYDIDRQCPMFGCDDDSEACLGDDVGATLAENGGMAQGAKLSIFDVASDEDFLSDYAGNSLWEPCLEAGCKIHSGSFGTDGTCELLATDVVYDEFMYQVTPPTRHMCPTYRENLKLYLKVAGCLHFKCTVSVPYDYRWILLKLGTSIADRCGVDAVVLR